MRTQKFLAVAALATTFVAGSVADGHAQWRHGHGPVRAVVVAPYYYYSPFWYDPWFPDYQWGGYGPYGPYRYYNVDPGGSVKLEVKPRQAQVYVDGYYAGIVDDFDGAFQRLRTTPGQHEIQLYLDGYRAVQQKVYLQPDITFKLKYEMERLGSGEQAEPRPQPANPPQQGYGPGSQPPARGPYGRRVPPPQGNPRDRDPRDARPADADAYGTLSIRVQPGAAEILVDGEKWNGPEGQERIFVELPEGRHTVEIRKSGYRTYVAEIDIRRGETTPLNVSLRTPEEE